eukprot:CAMPEP_0168218290 /NCGR_PEP_ID=MMETSP0140_2-20121125/7800_1 /TAXON_ID=44445 /ORGANISM="Pseudo-nitzschia australis, Strain 10249 10 AB" /LENGTH=79 /DNA_ID=CAMNT_0008146299 /DNA_START=238 /DNA_END=477 /DNA_ORIENTATION=+
MLTPPYSYGYAIDPVHDLSAFREDANTKTTSTRRELRVYCTVYYAKRAVEQAWCLCLYGGIFEQDQDDSDAETNDKPYA